MVAKIKSSKKMSVNQMTKIAMMSVLSFILMQISFPIPIFPSFLKIDASDVPALIGGFAMGPLAGVIIVGIKNILHLFQTSTGGVGELSNFLIGASIVIPSALIYQKNRTKRGAILGLLFGSLLMPIVGALTNYFVIIPFYSKIMPIEIIVELGTIVNPRISNVETLVLFGVVPFNVVKATLLSVLTLILYKHISPLLQKKI